MGERRVYLYAFSTTTMRVVDVKFLCERDISIKNVIRIANWMRDRTPESVRVYAVDNRPGLYKEFQETIRSGDFTKQIEFADLVSREGIQV